MTILRKIKEESDRLYGISKDVEILIYHFIVDGGEEWFYANNHAKETEKSIWKRIKKTYGEEHDYDFMEEDKKWERQIVPYKDAKSISKEFVRNTS